MENEVSSELYSEHDYISNVNPTFNCKNVVSKFVFHLDPKPLKIDSDGDIEVERKPTFHTIEIEHSRQSSLDLVGLQIWRGALLLADWLIYNNKLLPDGVILELGSGVGLTSIVAAFYRPVVCTDLNQGGILELIDSNVIRNQKLLENSIKIKELNFFKEFTKELLVELHNVKIILAADVVYDNTITEAFVNTIEKLLAPSRSIYIALEKRYVFTITDSDTVAPCYDFFLDCLKNLKNVKMEEVELDFPQYFQYDRVKELVLWNISSNL